MARSQQDWGIALFGGVCVLAAIGIGALLRPDLVYDQFIWQYFWGPVQADAAGHPVQHSGVTAYPGYTLVNGIGYGLVAGYFLLLLLAALRRFSIFDEQNLVLYLVPFIVGGGALRVIEDIATQTSLVTPPFQYLLISPLIYFVMAGLVFVTLLAGVYLETAGITSDYKHVLFAGGSVFLLAVLGVIVSTVAVTVWWIGPATVGGAAVILAVYAAILGQVTGTVPQAAVLLNMESLLVLYGHLVDGVSTALAMDWLGAEEKHPIPAAFIAYTGSPYAFIGLKLAVLSIILYYMYGDETVRAEDPVFFNLVLIGIFSVGMGPGIRNLTRATFGV